MGILSGEGEMISILHADENLTRENFDSDQEYIEHLERELEIANKESDELIKQSMQDIENRDLREKATTIQSKVDQLASQIHKLKGPPTTEETFEE